ncbi:MAG: single-stranded DNA-binding protein [Opitutales bacterium]|nr:single-stranded DNA-binding protein [Opitutales bacterium]
MASFNKVILMGNLTRDPELRQTQSGTSVCRFSIAVNRSYNAQDGNLREETCFVEVDSFGRTAENIGKYFSKGKPILLEGRLRQDTWDDKDTGKSRSKLVVVLDRFEFVGGARDSSYSGGGDDQPSSGASYKRTSPAPRGKAPERVEELEDDDVPF